MIVTGKRQAPEIGAIKFFSDPSACDPRKFHESSRISTCLYCKSTMSGACICCWFRMMGYGWTADCLLMHDAAWESQTLGQNKCSELWVSFRCDVAECGFHQQSVSKMMTTRNVSRHTMELLGRRDHESFLPFIDLHWTLTQQWPFKPFITYFYYATLPLKCSHAISRTVWLPGGRSGPKSSTLI